MLHTPPGKPRARALGLMFDGTPGPFNAITDVAGVSVGYTTLISGNGPLVMGQGPIRTGVSAILPRPRDQLGLPVFAGFHSLNGNGEMSGTHYIEEMGKLSLPITITNTNSCGLARDATIRWAVEAFPDLLVDDFALPVAAETYDGFLNDINGFHVTTQHVVDAINNATTGAIDEGSVGGGTGMKCFGFKAGSGTASRLMSDGFTLGVFVQANFGSRADLTIRGHRLHLTEPAMHEGTPDLSLSSIITIIATDAPFLPHQLKRLARRATFGIGRVGGHAYHGSGDIFLAFSTANSDITGAGIKYARFIPDEAMDPYFHATAAAVEEAILNAMVAADPMTGQGGNHVPALPHDVLRGLAGK
ncbi:P1 family peptidase [Pseudorhodobacter ferrugineus]|uniref:DmpA family aminopeptidase n=1 Tax=Pseudorhodobacter ferrugineus TaxID=77008 RepID=UPI0003B790D6|nr:P1 family peptidase [Pseudorhodobacter ferrugineus]